MLIDIEQVYAWLADHKLEAARALGEPRWAQLGDEHTRLWRSGEKPRAATGPDADIYFDETTMSQLLAHAGVLGAPAENGGFGDEQAMRLLRLLARTGRRVSELRLLNFDCPLPINGLAAATDGDEDRDAVVCKLRYHQTKIDGAPDTIFIDGEVRALISRSRHGRTPVSAVCRATPTQRPRGACSSRPPATTRAATPTPAAASPTGCTSSASGWTSATARAGGLSSRTSIASATPARRTSSTPTSRFTSSSATSGTSRRG